MPSIEFTTNELAAIITALDHAEFKGFKIYLEGKHTVKLSYSNAKSKINFALNENVKRNGIRINTTAYPTEEQKAELAKGMG